MNWVNARNLRYLAFAPSPGYPSGNLSTRPTETYSRFRFLSSGNVSRYEAKALLPDDSFHVDGKNARCPPPFHAAQRLRLTSGRRLQAEARQLLGLCAADAIVDSASLRRP